jgi:hypothetical protein
MTKQFSNIVFSYEAVSEPFPEGRPSDYDLLTRSIPIFRIETCYMRVFDAAEPEQINPMVAIMASARLQPIKVQPKIHQLKLTSNALNTYVVDLTAEVNPPAETPTEVLKITGRNSKDNREEIRKQFLAGLANSNYLCSVEEARGQVLDKFSLMTLRMVFNSYPELIQLNTPSTQAYFRKILGTL